MCVFFFFYFILLLIYILNIDVREPYHRPAGPSAHVFGSDGGPTDRPTGRVWVKVAWRSFQCHRRRRRRRRHVLPSSVTLAQPRADSSVGYSRGIPITRYTTTSCFCIPPTDDDWLSRRYFNILWRDAYINMIVWTFFGTRFFRAHINITVFRASLVWSFTWCLPGRSSRPKVLQGGRVSEFATRERRANSQIVVQKQ